jgi:tetratricopeptide (TPR) repeat protein
MVRYPFVGREDELADLRGWADEVADSSVGRFVLVVGVAGMGKTRLCEELLRRWERPGVATAWVRCWAEAAGPPLWPWPEIVAELGARRAAPGGAVPPEAARDRFGVFRAIVERLSAACATGPCLAIIDDLHAASPDVRLLSRFVARSLHRFPLLLVATWRIERGQPDDPCAGLETLARDANVVELGPLGLPELAEYMRRVLDMEPNPVAVAGLLDSTGGNPMYVAELVERPPAAGPWQGSGLVGALEWRVARLPTGQRHILGAAAVMGAGTTLEEVSRIVGCPPASVAAAVDDMASGATCAGSEIRFSHELIRQAFASLVPARERLRLHVAASAAIHGQGIDQLVRRARHAVEAATLAPDHRTDAVSASVAATDALLEAMAFEQARQVAAAGCSMVDGTFPPAMEATALLGHARAVMMCGRLGDARALFDRAVGPAERSGDPRLLAIAALGLGGVWVEEQRDELSRRRLLALCRRARAALPDGEAVLAARLDVRLAAEEAYGGRSIDDVRTVVEAVRRLGDPAATAEALSLLHHTLLGPEHTVERLAIADELLDAAALAGATGGGTIYSLFGLCWRTVDLYLAGSRDAERSFVELRDRAEALGAEAVGYIVSVVEVMRTFRRGDLAAVESLAERALALGQRVGDADSLAYYGAHLLALAWVRGRLGEMRDLITSVRESATLRRNDVSYDAVYALSCALAGDEPTARAVLDTIRAGGIHDVAVPSNRMTTWMVLAELAVALDDRDLASELEDALAPHAHLPVMPSLAIACLGPGQRAVGLACVTAGRVAEAVEWFRAGLDAVRRLGNRPVEALVRADLADILGRRNEPGDADEAAELYASAIRLGTELGLADRVDAWTWAAECLRAVQPADPVHRQASLRRRPSGWCIEIEDRSAQIGDLVGMRHIAALLARPDTDLRASDLAAVVESTAPAASVRGMPVIDAQARREYQRRIAQLDHELDVADLVGDAERGRRAAEERQIIIDSLRRNTGLGGRARRMSDDADRSRMRVSKAIHRAIQRVGEADSVIGHTLDNRIRTGHVCRYVADPGAPIDWTVESG